MISICETTYREVAASLASRLEGAQFFNGTVEYDTDEFYSSLTCTLILCRDAQTGRLLSVLPVWWEYHLHLCDGEALTDFCWTELDRLLTEHF